MPPEESRRRPATPEEDEPPPLQTPASPSNSWNSSTSEHETAISESGDCGPTRGKRCKISKEQLSVLIEHFESEPLPNFDQRQILAQKLGMTPRSVQIWFQNRRQRLKPSAQKSGNNARQGSWAGAGSYDDGNLHRAGIGGVIRPPPAPFIPSVSTQDMGRYGPRGLATPVYGEDMYYHMHAGGPSAGAFSHTYGYERRPTIDMTDKFAATKALLGSGYHAPSSILMASQRAAFSASPATTPMPTCHSCAPHVAMSMPMPNMPPHPMASAPVSAYGVAPAYVTAVHPTAPQTSNSGRAYAPAAIPVVPSPGIPLGAAPAVSRAIASAPRKAAAAEAAADGLLMLLACADSSTTSSAPVKVAT